MTIQDAGAVFCSVCLEEREKQPLIEEMMNVFPFILEELGMIALMEVVFLLLRVKGRGASTKKRSET